MQSVVTADSHAHASQQEIIGASPSYARFFVVTVTPDFKASLVANGTKKRKVSGSRESLIWLIPLFDYSVLRVVEAFPCRAVVQSSKSLADVEVEIEPAAEFEVPLCLNKQNASALISVSFSFSLFQRYCFDVGRRCVRALLRRT